MKMTTLTSVRRVCCWNFPLLMAAWKLAPALAAGNCVVMKPAEQTPVTILLVMELIQDILPAGVVNIVNGFGAEAGAALSQSTRIAKLAFTGSTAVGNEILKCAANNGVVRLKNVAVTYVQPNTFTNMVLDLETRDIVTGKQFNELS